MTNSISPITADSSGHTATTSESSTEGSPFSPERGIARLRETEVYHLMNLVQSALYEADHLIGEVLGKARPRYLDHDNTTEPLNGGEVTRLLGEAYQCANLAVTYIDKAAMGLLDLGAETPF